MKIKSAEYVNSNISSFDLVFGGFKQKDFDSNNGRDFEHQNYRKESSYAPITTFYANTRIYSQRSPRKYPKEVGKLCKKVFEDE